MTKRKKSNSLIAHYSSLFRVFLAGIMAVYAISGILLILEIPIFKTKKKSVKTIAPNLNGVKI
jgi:hypothetical protein